MSDAATLVLRLAGPLQAWGGPSQFNRRATSNEPTKGGILGLLAAAAGRRRSDPLEDLLDLRLGVRVDQQGTLLRDYHTVSDYRGVPLKSASVDSRGRQKPTTTGKTTHVTHRYYLQDAVFVAAVSGSPALVEGLAEAVVRPAFPLALGRRSCPPTQPLLITPPGPDAVWTGGVEAVLAGVSWQAADRHRQEQYGKRERPASLHLPVTIDDPQGDDVRNDVPTSFVLGRRRFSSRRVRTGWVTVPSGFSDGVDVAHDPFALLGR